MATGNNTATYQTTGIVDHNELLNRDAAKQHPISAIDGLTDHLSAIDTNIAKLNTNFLVSIQTLVSHLNDLLDPKKFAEEYKLVTEATYIADLEDINTQLATINELVEIWDDSKTSQFEELKAKVAGLDEQLAPFLTQIATYSSNTAALSSTAAALRTDLDALKLLVEASSGQTDTISALAGRLDAVETELDQVGSIDDDHTKRLQHLEGITKKYLPHTEGEGDKAKEVQGELYDQIGEVSTLIPTSAEVTKTNSLAEAKDDDFINYKVKFMREATAEEKTSDPDLEKKSLFQTELRLTGEVKALINHMQSGYIGAITELTNRINDLNVWVSALSENHELNITNIYICRAATTYSTSQTDEALAWFNTRVANDLMVSLDLSEHEQAILNASIQTPESLRAARFYIIFETSYPILNPESGLVESPVCLAFPNFAAKSRAIYGTGESSILRIYCTPFGIPGMNKAFYILHAGTYNDSNSNETYLEPFTIGTEETDGSFGNNFTFKGEFPFMLKVTDPANTKNTSSRAASIKADYYCYFGTSQNANFTAEDLDKFTVVSDLTAPAAHINWSKYNRNTSSYYYYLVPEDSLPEYETEDADQTCWLRFETGLGTGGWQLRSSLDINEVSYAVFRTNHALTFSPPTTIRIAPKPAEES